jgi:hypothetical protein
MHWRELGEKRGREREKDCKTLEGKKNKQTKTNKQTNKQTNPHEFHNTWKNARTLRNIQNKETNFFIKAFSWSTNED